HDAIVVAHSIIISLREICGYSAFRKSFLEVYPVLFHRVAEEQHRLIAQHRILGWRNAVLSQILTGKGLIVARACGGKARSSEYDIQLFKLFERNRWLFQPGLRPHNQYAVGARFYAADHFRVDKRIVGSDKDACDAVFLYRELCRFLPLVKLSRCCEYVYDSGRS